MKILFKSWVLLLLLLTPLSGSAQVSPKPNPYEAKIIHKEILESFQNLMSMWKEELYFDMYDLGLSKFNLYLNKVDFAQRMVDLQWKPALAPEKIEELRIDYRSFAEIHTVIEFENKVNPSRKVKKRMVFQTVLEKKIWKFDLTQLIRIPFDGKMYQPTPPSKKKKIKSKTESDSTVDSSPDINKKTK